jgi:spore germination cell wall hydrolase CwlJ-like protein
MERFLLKMLLGVLTVLVPAAVTWWAVSDEIGTAHAQAQYRFTAETTPLAQVERELECMTRNIYYEAATEPAEGKLAVAQITMNRVADPRFPNDVCAVVYQKNRWNDRTVCQFSWYCDGSMQRRRVVESLWLESRAAAKKVMFEGWRLPSLERSMFYHADYVNPGWRKDRIIQIGRHIFYQDRDV